MQSEELVLEDWFAIRRFLLLNLQSPISNLQSQISIHNPLRTRYSPSAPCGSRLVKDIMGNLPRTNARYGRHRVLRFNDVRRSSEFFADRCSLHELG